MSRRFSQSRPRNLGKALEISISFILILFAIHGVNVIFGMQFNRFGIFPRDIDGMRGILFSPLLHANMNHLVANCSTLFTLSTLIFWINAYRPVKVLIIVWLTSGLATWFLGRSAIHIGASSVIYGLTAYLIVSGFLMKSWVAALISILVAFFYGGLAAGVLPEETAVSWEGHLFGALAGGWAAFRIHKKPPDSNRQNRGLRKPS